MAKQPQQELIVRGLTAQEKTFVAEYVSTADLNHAVKVSGYLSPSGALVFDPSRSAKIVAAIQAEVSSRIRTAGAVIGHNVLIEVAQDKDAPKGVRVDAAKALLDRAGHVAPRASDPLKAGDRALADYSVSELRALVDRLEQQRGDEAKDVTPRDGAPIRPTAAPQLTEMLD